MEERKKIIELQSDANRTVRLEYLEGVIPDLLEQTKKISANLAEVSQSLNGVDIRLKVLISTLKGAQKK